MAIVEQEAVPLEAEGVSVTVPDWMAEIVTTFSHLARSSPHVNQRSGVSVRLSVSNYEVLVANAARRALQRDEIEVVPRVSDLDALMASTAGKIEIETIEEGREGAVIETLLKGAVLETFKQAFTTEELREVVEGFDEGQVVHTGDDLGSDDYAQLLADHTALQASVNSLTESESPAVIASAVELILEGLHLSKRLNKEAIGQRATYRGRG